MLMIYGKRKQILNEDIAMSEQTILPAPVLEPFVASDDKWHREQGAFRRLLPQLLQTHPNQYVAIHEERPVDSDDDLVTLALRVYGRFGYRPIYMDLVTEQPVIVRIPHYRVLGKA